MIRTSIYLTEEQHGFIQKKCLNLSAFVRTKIEELMAEELKKRCK